MPDSKPEKLGDVGGFVRSEIIAQLFGVGVRRIQQLTQDGILPTTETKQGRRYDLVPTIQSYISHLSDKAHGREHSAKEIELKQQKLEAEIALKESQGELHRLKTDITAGKYISIEEATVNYTRFFVSFKRFALSLPPRLVGMIGGYADPVEARRIEKALTAETCKLLESFVVAGVAEPPKKRRKKAAEEPPREADTENAE